MSETKKDVKDVPWGTKLCPLLSIAGLRQPQSKLVGVGSTGGGEAVACQGPHCMMFQPIADERGVVVDAKCALSLTPMAVSQLAGVIQTAVSNFKKA